MTERRIGAAVDDGGPLVRFSVLTIFPETLEAAFSASLLGKARERGVVDIETIDIRQYAAGPHLMTDDAPFGGGAGMVMKPEPIVAAIEAVVGARKHRGTYGRKEGAGAGAGAEAGVGAGAEAGVGADAGKRARVILLSPGGKRFTQEMAKELARERHLVFVCGRYEGVDDRVRAHFVDDEVSIGDYVLGGGEAAAWVVVEAVARLVPGVVGNAASIDSESFVEGLLEYPQYTRPRVFRGRAVPDVLVSGDHAAIAKWRREAQIARTKAERADLYARWIAKCGKD
ncbi:MAG: tRNA (guanosine(37)-N1)-methyltransferase TrmD [Deltaproteobacteria bacterium]|nr:tRNA (guanosine(37)-N1)-methyltransferase TrmD [Deltaproteobacteria bacterium]